MYLVVSKWQALPGKEEEFEEIGKKMRDLLRSQPGVVMVEAFKCDGYNVAVAGYENEEVYNQLIHDPNGPFETAARGHNVEEIARWLGSEKGETLGA